MSDPKNLENEIEESKDEPISNSKKEKKVKAQEKAEQEAEANAEVEIEAINGTPRFNKLNQQ